MKQVLLLVWLAIGLIGCPASSSDGRTAKVIALAKIQHKCADVQFLHGASDWKVLNVCGTKRYYAYEVWCSDYSPTWRERK